MDSATMLSDAQFAKEINLLAQDVRKLAAVVVDRSLSRRLAEIADETDALVMRRPDAVGPAMMDRADVEVARFDVAKAALGVAEALVGEDEGGGGEAVPGKRASDHIDSVEGGFRGDGLGFARP